MHSPTRTSSLAPIKPALLLEACEAYLEDRQARIRKRIEKEIVLRIGVKRWRKPPTTRADAIAEIQDKGGTFGYSLDDHIRDAGSHWSEKVERLRTMAIITPDDQDIYIDEAGVHALSDYLMKRVMAA